MQKIKFVEEYRLNDKNYFQLQISILCHHVPGEPAYMLSKCQSVHWSVVPFHGMKVLSGQYCMFRLSAMSSKFSHEILHVKFDLQRFVTEMFR